MNPLWIPLVSLAAALPIALSGRKPNLREFWTFAAALIKFGLVLSLLPLVLRGETPGAVLFEALPGGLSIRFRVDAMGMLFALVASGLWIVTSLYSVGYMRAHHEPSQTRFFFFFAVSLAATLGVAFAGNLLTLYLFYELLSLSTYPLVTHHQDEKARAGGRKYLTYLLGSSVALALPTLIAAYHFSGGNLEFGQGGFLPRDLSPGLLTAILLMFVFGFAKAGLMPLHAWLPGAMVAPTPVSALLHAVAVVKAGVFCVLRIFRDGFGLENLAWVKSLGGISPSAWVTIIAVFTMLTASLLALRQEGLKARLAYSTVGQLAYIVLGASLLTPLAFTGATLHIAMHAVGKITLFFCAGAIYVASGKTTIRELRGIGRTMPITMGAFFIGSLAVIGLPPTGGFISKWHLVLGAWDAGGQTGLMVLSAYLLSSFLNACYFLPIVYHAFFLPPPPNTPNQRAEAPWACLVPLVFTATLCVWLFFHPNPFLKLATLAAAGG